MAAAAMTPRESETALSPASLPGVSLIMMLLLNSYVERMSERVNELDFILQTCGLAVRAQAPAARSAGFAPFLSCGRRGQRDANRLQ
jgi:hypothetical protein